MGKVYTRFQIKWTKNPTRWGGTGYLYGLFREVSLPPPPREARDCDRDSMRPLLQLSYLLTGDSAGTVGREYLRGRALGQSKKRATVCSVLSLLSAGHSHRGNILHIIKTRIFLLSILFLIDYTTEGIKVVLLGLPLRESRKAFWFPTMGSFVLSLCTDAPLP